MMKEDTEEEEIKTVDNTEGKNTICSKLDHK